MKKKSKLMVHKPNPVSLVAKTPADMAWVIFHEGFRCGYHMQGELPWVQPTEETIRKAYEEFAEVLMSANS